MVWRFRVRAGPIARDYWALATLIGGSAIVWSVGLPVPTSGAFSSPSSLISLLSVIAGVLASIVGIAVAVVLVSLQLLGTTYAVHAVREVLRAGALRQLLVLYLWTILICVAALSLIGKSVPPQSVGLGYLATYLFAACLLALYPSIKSILGSSRVSASRIRELASSVDSRATSMLSQFRFHPLADGLEFLEEHPLFTLSEIAVRSIRERDRVTPKLVVGIAGRRLAELVEERTATETREIFGAFLQVFRPTARAAMETRDEAMIEVILRTMTFVHEVAAKRRVPWHCLIEFNECFDETASASASSGMESSTRVAVFCIEEIMKAHLQHNVAAEKDIWTFHWEEPAKYGPPDHEIANQWEHVSREYTRMLVHLVTAANDADNSDAASSGLHGLSSVIEQTASTETLSTRQRDEIIRTCQWEAEDLVLRVVERMGKMPVMGLFAFNYYHVKTAMAKEQPWAKRSLLHFCHALLRLAELRMVDRQTLNELGAIGRDFVHEIHSGIRYSEALVLISETFARIGGAYGHPRTAREMGVVRELLQQLESLERWDDGQIKSGASARDAVVKALMVVRAIEIPSEVDTLEKLSWPTFKSSPLGDGDADSTKSSDT